MAVYKISSSQFSKVVPSEFVGDENRLFYVVNGDNVTFFLSDGETPGGTPISIGGTGGVTQTLSLSGTTLSILGGNSVDLSSIDTTVDLTGYATETFVANAVNTAVNGLIDGAGGALDTLNELAAAVNNDPNFATTIFTALDGKVNLADFESLFDINLATVNTDEIAEGVVNLYYTDARVQDVINNNTNNYITTADIPTNVSAFTNDAGYITSVDIPDSPVTSVNTQTGDVVLTTTDITEGTNLYYTDARVQAVIDGNTNNYITTADIPTNVSAFTNDVGYITTYTETDPVFTASPAGGITTTQITNWDTAFTWGDHSVQGYLTSYTETDPVFTASPAGTITNANIANWNTSFGWGDHATAGYLTSYTETDPIFTASIAAGITSTQVTNWDTAFSWGDHSVQGYLTSFTETDPIFTASAASGIGGTDIANWNTAFGWGDHSTAGYLVNETVTSLSLATNILTYTDELGATTNIDLSVYLDDTNLARLVSGTVDGVTGIATFTRDDASTFTVDFSALFDDTNLTRITTSSFNTTTGDLTLTRDDATTVTTNLDGRYLTSYTETDPVFTASVAAGITGTDVSNWNTAFAWGDHSTQGYITSAPVTSVNTLTGDVVLTTDNITEGTTNLYYSDTLVETYLTNNPVTVSGDLVVDSLQFTGGTGDQGLLTWNVDEETVNLVMNGTTHHIGQDTLIHVRNNTAGVLAKGTAVMVVGTLGASGRLLVEPMIADGTVMPRYFIGVTSEDIAANTDGMVMTFGKIRQIDTSVWPEGSVLWLDPVANGGLTTTEPEAPNLKIATAFVVSSGTSGTLMIRANPGIDLHNNHRVQIVNPDVYGNPTVAGSTLMWNNTLQRWENRTPAEHLADVGLTNAIVSGDNISELVNDAGYITSAPVTSVAGKTGEVTLVKADITDYAEGPGSGLNADLLDGYHANQFLGPVSGILQQSTMSIRPNEGTSYSELRFHTQDSTNGDSFSRIYWDSSSMLFQVGAKNAGASASSGNILFSGYFNADIGTFRVRKNNINHDIWHAGNDGTGSGLDADLLDGEDGAYYLDYNNLTNAPDSLPRIPFGSAPASSIGTTGDAIGDLKADATYIYYCIANYDGVTNIWKRVAWSTDTW